MLLSLSAFGQRQLVVLKGDRVVQRIHANTFFDVRDKDSRTVHRGFLVEADEFSFITSRDTFSIREVEAISTGKRRTFWSVVGSLMTTGGAGYLLIDQFNRYIVYGGRNPQDPAVWKTAGVLIGIGFPLSKAKRRWDKPGTGNVRLMSVDFSSRFFREKE
ncbi:MAG: hypothetical protein ACKOYP_00965 [Bacteroidota bacterium]